MTTDAELLRQFARTNSDAAFAELVRRHVNLVYSAALRQVNGDEHLARDVSQSVFTDLARKAGSLARRESLTGWLYTSAHFAAANIVRGENRRRDREEKFMREPAAETAPDADWEKLRPALDDAMHELKEADREAILLRYFENRPFAEVGAKLGLNENAVRMRVERALEKLRGIFAKRGVTTATALASAISANAIQMAPANLAATLTAASLATAGTGTFTLLKMMTVTKLKLAFSTLVVAGAATAFVLQHQAQEKLRAENESLTQQLAQLQTDNAGLSNRIAAVGDSRKMSDEQFMELLRLRSEVTHLRQATNVLATVAKSKTNNLPDADTIEIHLKARFISLPTEDLQALGTGSTGMQGGKTGLLTQKQFNRFHEELQGANDVEMISEPEVRFSNGQQTRMSAMQPVPVDGTNADIGTSLGATCYFSTNSSTFNLSLDAKLSELTGDPLKPDVQTIQATNQLTLFPGQTAFLEQQILPGGWLPDSTNSFAEARSLLVFITPTVVNARGNPINSPPSQ